MTIAGGGAARCGAVQHGTVLPGPPGPTGTAAQGGRMEGDGCATQSAA